MAYMFHSLVTCGMLDLYHYYTSDFLFSGCPGGVRSVATASGVVSLLAPAETSEDAMPPPARIGSSGRRLAALEAGTASSGSGSSIPISMSNSRRGSESCQNSISTSIGNVSTSSMFTAGPASQDAESSPQQR